MYRLCLPFQLPSPDGCTPLGVTAAAPDMGGPGKQLFELVSLRVLQINGCPYFREMYAGALRGGGVPDAKLDSLAGWSASAHFSERERAALQWVESRMNVPELAAPDKDCDPPRIHFSDEEISDLGFTIALMSTFNRLLAGMRW